MKIGNSIFEGGKVEALNALVVLPLPIKEAYRLMKFVKELKEKEDVYQGVKISIFKKYGNEKKDGTIEIKKENQKKAFKELNELLAIKEEYSLDRKIVLPNNIEFSAAQLMSLEDVAEVKNA